MLQSRQEEADLQALLRIQHASTQETQGRTTGSLEWRQARGELGMSLLNERVTQAITHVLHPNHFQLNGHASVDAQNTLILTQPKNDQIGSAFYKSIQLSFHPESVKAVGVEGMPQHDRVWIEFAFRITKSGGAGADGMVIGIHLIHILGPCPSTTFLVCSGCRWLWTGI